MAARLFGAWSLVSFEARSHDGSVDYLFGRNPVGSVLFLQNGYMGANLIYDDLQSPKPAGEPNTLSLCGSVEADDATYTFTTHCSSDPSVILGQKNFRNYTITGSDPERLSVTWSEGGRDFTALWNRIW